MGYSNGMGDWLPICGGKMKNSLQRKLLYSFMLVIAVVLIGVSLGVSLIIKEEMLATKQQELIEKGSELAVEIENFQQVNGNLVQLPQFLTTIDSLRDCRVWVVDSSRKVIAVSDPQRRGDPPRGMGERPGNGMGKGMGMGHGSGHPMGNNPIPEQNGMAPVGKEMDQVFSGLVWTGIFEHPFYGEKMLVVAVPIRLANGSVSAALILNAPVTEMNAFMEHIYYYIAIAGLVAFILALLVVSWLTRGIIRPLKAMEETAAAMAKGDYSNHVKVETSDEVGRLGLALNSLAQDLAKNIEELNQMEKLRRDFVANVSHEFRTPMTIIRGYNEALMDGTISDPVLIQKYHQLMGDETVRLERLINDLLDLSRLQSTTVTIDKEKLPLASVVDSVVNLLRQQAEQKQIIMSTTTEEDLPEILGNGDRIIQLLLIIVDNALKYTLSGGAIRISTFLEDECVVLRVADTGIGIPAEDLPYIWERLYKVEKSHCRADGGTGLGLAIAKEIIDLHHATVTVSSELSRGTTMTIYFPVVRSENK
jgi:signal transduction histidine kinase